MVLKKSADGERRRAKDADPSGSFNSKHGAEQEVQPYSRPDRQNRTEKLAGRKPEENGFLVITDFLDNFDFDKISPSFITPIVLSQSGRSS